jgi:hypothetical protein
MKKNEQMNTISKGQLEKSIQNNSGIKTLTAKELKICRNTLNKYIEKYSLTEFLEEQKEVIRDLVRLNIVNAIKNGDIKVSLWYAERQMFEEFGERKTVISENRNAFEEMTEEEMKAEIERLGKAL